MARIEVKTEEIQIIMNLENFLYYVIDYRFTFGGIIKGTQDRIFHRSDFQDFYTIKPSWVGDFGD